MAPDRTLHVQDLTQEALHPKILRLIVSTACARS